MRSVTVLYCLPYVLHQRIQSLSVEVEVFLWACCLEFILDFCDFILRLFVTKWVREGEVGHFVWLVAEHVLEF